MLRYELFGIFGVFPSRLFPLSVLMFIFVFNILELLVVLSIFNLGFT